MSKRYFSASFMVRGSEGEEGGRRAREDLVARSRRAPSQHAYGTAVGSPV
jgi:hypothetical protein